MMKASLLVLFSALVVAQSGNTAPESFKANAQMSSGAAGSAAVITITIDRYTDDADHESVAKALKDGGNAEFVKALRKAPVVGTLSVGNRNIPIRWARQRPKDNNRQIAIITEEPVYFVGGGKIEAKPTEGYDVAIAEFTVDSIGLGEGSMAPAAKVKLGGPTGVQVDDYAGKLVTLVSVSRKIS
jgi:hypothetical protein